MEEYYEINIPQNLEEALAAFLELHAHLFRISERLNNSGAFVDRGDPSEWDWQLADLTTDYNWRDLDCSLVVPPDAVAVALYVYVKDDAADSVVYFRKKGNSNVLNSPRVRTQVADIPVDGFLTVPCDSNRIIEYRATNLTFTSINILITGWLNKGVS